MPPHPNIVSFLGAGIDYRESKAWLILEYCNGGSLEAVIQTSHQQQQQKSTTKEEVGGDVGIVPQPQSKSTTTTTKANKSTSKSEKSAHLLGTENTEADKRARAAVRNPLQVSLLLVLLVLPPVPASLRPRLLDSFSFS
jgi:hypothetical protein